MKYRRLSRWFNPYVGMTRADLIEVRAFLNTPGLTDRQVFALMLWNRNMARQLAPLAELDDEAQPLVEANMRGVEEADGKAMLHRILENFPNWSMSVPLWSTRYLQSRRRMGASVNQLAVEFRAKPAKIMRWWTADLFDPLTALPRERGWVEPSRYKILGI